MVQTLQIRKSRGINMKLRKQGPSGGGVAGSETTAGLNSRSWLRKGTCERNICGMEAGCSQVNATFFKCICPQDSMPPTPELRCPVRRLASETPVPIGHIIPPGNHSHQLAHVAGRGGVTAGSPLVLTLGVSLVLVVVLGAFSLCWCKRRGLAKALGRSKSSKHVPCSPSPRSLSKGVLVAERYASNPQYLGSATVPETVTTVQLPEPPPSSVPLLSRQTLRLEHELGEGCFGKVYRGELLLCEGNGEEVHEDERKQVAIKVLKSSASREAEEDFLREVEIMSAFKHPNILTLLGIVERDEQGEAWMVFEFMAHGDLADVLRANSRQLWRPLPGLAALNPAALHSVALQVASGMRYLAAQRFVHRDLACRNCLVGAGLVVKIADFGMSRDVYTCDYYKIGGSRMLPVRWMSPESVMYGRFTLESDVWSYGVVLWEIFSLGRQPYYGHSNDEVVKLILQGIMLIPPENCPALICDLMRCCWKTEPRDRIRFPEIYERLLKAPVPLPPPPTFLPPPLPTTIPLCTKLPLPPSVVTFDEALELLDTENYLLPKPIAPPAEYLETFPA